MPNYGDPQYWEDRYKDSNGKMFDWLEDFKAIEPLLDQVLKESCPNFEASPDWKQKVKILNLGCGNSVLAEDLYEKGFKQIYNMDISEVVISQMKDRNADKRPEMHWQVMDVRDLKYESGFFDLIIDKSTIDAILCGDDAFINTALMMKECQRVLLTGGVYLGISYGYPDSRILHYKRAHLSFDLRLFEIVPQNPKDSIHFVYVNKKLPDADEKCAAHWEEVVQAIKQQEKAESKE